jgi:hypothetical protein
MSDPIQTTPEIERLVASCLDHIDRMNFCYDRRAGVRCGLGDAAAICDLLAKELRAGRRSRRRAEIADALQRTGDLIMAYYHRVKVYP